jgi:hypothetical protein
LLSSNTCYFGGIGGIGVIVPALKMVKAVVVRTIDAVLALALKIFSTKDDNNHKLHITKRRGQPNPGPKDSNMFRIGPSACPCWCMLHCQTDQTEPKQNQNRSKRSSQTSNVSTNQTVFTTPDHRHKKKGINVTFIGVFARRAQAALKMSIGLPSVLDDKTGGKEEC